MYSTKDKPRVNTGDWPTQDVPPPTLARMYNDMSARCGQLLETLQALRDDPQTPAEIRQRIAEAIAGE